MKRLSFLTLAAALIGASPLPAGAQEDPFAAIYDTVLQPNADGAVESCATLRRTIPDGSETERHGAFEGLAKAWDRVQASYVLGGYDMDAMDYPLMVDTFHAGKEDVHASLERIVQSDTAAGTALYKNSYKTLNALDDVMFAGAWSPRRAELAEVIADNVCANLTLIRDGYREHRADNLGDPQKALSLLVNAEIESVYKTRDWRIAQVAGLTKRTVGQHLPQNQQYPYSKVSWAVIGAILSVHERLLADDRQPNIATIARGKGADEGTAAIQAALRRTVEAYAATPPGADFNTKDMIPIFSGLQALQSAFYDHLIAGLGVSVGLIDADGD